MDSVLGVQSVLGELFPIIVLGVLALSHHIGLDSKTMGFLVVH